MPLRCSSTTAVCTYIDKLTDKLKGKEISRNTLSCGKQKVEKKKENVFFFKYAKSICKYFLKQAIAVCREGNCGNYLQLLNSFHLSYIYVVCRLCGNQVCLNAFLLIYNILHSAYLVEYLHSVVLQMGHPKCLQTLDYVWVFSLCLISVP